MIRIKGIYEERKNAKNRTGLQNTTPGRIQTADRSGNGQGGNQEETGRLESRILEKVKHENTLDERETVRLRVDAGIQL